VSPPAGRINAVTTTAAHRQRRFLLSLLTLLTLLGATFGPTIDASATTRPTAETRVRAISHPTAALVATTSPPSPTAVGISGLQLRQLVSATGVATEAGAGLGDDALAYATRAEKLDHIFVPKHNLDPLVQQLGGREAVVEQMLSGVKGLTPASGTFEIPVTISGQTVVVRGAVVNGVVKLGTAFTP